MIQPYIEICGNVLFVDIYSDAWGTEFRRQLAVKIVNSFDESSKLKYASICLISSKYGHITSILRRFNDGRIKEIKYKGVVSLWKGDFERWLNV